MWYKIDWDKLILLLLPTFLRKPILFGYIRALLVPLAGSRESVYNRWYVYRDENIKKLSYNSQRCYLRKALNDTYDPSLRRITIGETLGVDQDYMYTQAENLDAFLGVLYLEQDFNYASGTVDFLISVP